MQVVGDDFQVIVVEQRPGNRLGGGADIDENRGVIGNLGGNGYHRRFSSRIWSARMA